MPIAYRSILQVPLSDDLFDVVGGLVNEWLVSKDLPEINAPGIVPFEDKQLSLTKASDGPVDARRWGLHETWEAPRDNRLRQLDDGVAVTTITVVRGPANAWLWIDTEAPRVERSVEDGELLIESQQAGTPRIVSELIGALGPTDGLAEPYSGVLQVAESRHIAELVDILRDDTRIGSAIVSAPPAGVSMADWTDKVETIIRGTDGMAVSYVLSVTAHTELIRQLGPTHSFRPGGLRTYLPGVQPFNIVDSYRHRVMGPATVRATHPRRLGHILRSGLVSRLESTRLPQLLQAADYALLRANRRLPLADLSGIMERSTSAGQSDDPDALLAINRELVANLEAERASVLDAVEEAIGLMDDLADSKETVGILELELEDAEGRYELSNDLATALRNRLIRAQAYDDAYAPLSDDEVTEYPDSFAELLERTAELTHLRYVGKAAQPLRLDEHPNIRPAVHKAWDAMLTLDNYASLSISGAFNGGFTHYFQDPSHGGIMRMLNYKPTEGEVVQNDPKLSSQREVDIPGVGRVMMTAHVGLLNRRAGAPRLYFMDRVAQDECVYLGYIGEHLLNAKLN